MLKLINNKICIIMKKFFSVIALLALSVSGYAQDVDNFEVGPYEVDYKGSGDYKFRLRKGVDLYEYFGLKKDTTIQVTETPSSPIKGAFQLNALMSLPYYTPNGTSNVWGVDGAWKQMIGQKLYFNAGLFVGISVGKYGEAYKKYKDWKDGPYKETLFEIGVPLSIELSNLDRNKSSLYGSIGVVPTFYTGGKDPAGESKSGIFVAPRIDFGGYLPVGKQLVRLGGFFQYDINCSAGDYDIFKERIGRSFIGGNIGLVF